MKRTNSWKNLQRTFASTPISTVKRPKINRKSFESSKSSVDENNSFQIEDSDEENAPCVNRTLLKTPTKTQLRPKVAKSIPLLINTSISTSKVDDSVILNSDSGESVDGEPELRDVSTILKTRHPKKARSKSLFFLKNDEQNQSTSCHNEQTRTTLKDITPTKQQQKSKSNAFKKTIVNCHQRLRHNNDDTISESESLDDNESPTKQCQNSAGAEVIKRQHSEDIFFTQSPSSASIPAIESASSQFSLSLKSQQPAPNRRYKQKRYIKGGLVERLNKVMSSAKSDFSFWMNERTSDLIESGEKMCIKTIDRSYGRVLLHCSSNNNKPNHSSVDHILCIDPMFKKLSMLQTGKTIEVCFDTYGYRTANGSLFHPNVTKILI